MKKIRSIVVTGGKGGTGKSTVAILLAFKAVKKNLKVLLVDLDVECPNDYLILGLDELENIVKSTFTHYPVIDADKCTKCGLCVSSCTSNALFQSPGKPPVLNKILCSSCGVCWNVCPVQAISKKEEKNGAIYSDKLSDNLTLITGRSLPGVRETSPVVEQAKKYAYELLDKSDDFDLIIFDTAAGTHCNVIRALEDVDEAIAVTEPTPLGKHDLAIILGVLDVLEVPYGVVVNQYDIGKMELITEMLDKRSIKKRGKVPYSKDLAEIYSSGKFFENKDLSNLLDMDIQL